MRSLDQQITDLWGQITAATHRFLELVGEFDETNGWAGAGIMSCAHWLNVFCGIGMVAAREKVRVARAIRELPEINAAFGEGRVSYSKVRAMTRVATAENESILLNIAIHGTAAHVERTVRYFRKVERIEEAREAAETHRNRFLTIRYDDDDHIVIHGRLPIEVGELVRQALERAMELVDPATGSIGNAMPTTAEPTTAEPAADDSAESSDEIEAAVPEDTYLVGARRADALRLIAEQFLAGTAGDSAGTPDRYQVVVHIDHRLLADQSLPGDHSAGGRVLSEIEDGPPLAVETARRLACDAALIGSIDDENGEPLNLGRKTRTLSPALKRALKARDQGCRFPGCTHTRFTEGHHIVHWANGGETSLSNLITLCHFHHHLVHEGGFSVERTDDGLVVFREPDGSRVRDSFAVAGRFRGNTLADLNRERGIAVGPKTVVTRWLGETMDYSLAIDALLAARSRCRAGARSPGSVAAET
jgi:hypothetical protein